MREARIWKWFLAALALACACATFSIKAHAQAGDHDFLTPAEADKVRDAQSPNDRVRLFISFADDRMKKLQYELNNKAPTENREMLLNGLLNGYTGCMDEATDRLQDAREKGVDMRSAIKEMQKQVKAFLDALHKIESAGGPELDSFKDSLSDAIDSTQDALNAAAKASKEYGAVPVRRKP